MPVLRDTDASYYIREEGGALLVGPFERDTVAWSEHGVPEDFHSSLLEPCFDRLEGILEQAIAHCAADAASFAGEVRRLRHLGPFLPGAHAA